MRFQSIRMKSILLLVALVCGVRSAFDSEFKVVDTNNGRIRGFIRTTLLKNSTYYSFKGIPYAKPPIGELRFKAPQPSQPWKPAILDALDHGKICIQPVDWLFEQSEDCLTLNVYVPADLKPNEKLAVLVYIHGGGFWLGAGNDYYFGPDFLLEKRVIVATLNYRLGIFGFLSLDHPEFSGNMGLKDQQLALKWIKENIDAFGGDSDRITISGQSAGSASTVFQILSSESRQYFRNAAAFSASYFSYWAMAENNSYLDLAYKIAADLGESISSFDQLVRFFQSVAADKIKKFSTNSSIGGRLEFLFKPVIERADAKRAFVVKSPGNIYETETITTNTLFTYTSAEILAFMFSPGWPTTKDLNENFDILLPFRGLNIEPDSEEYRKFLDKVRQLYFGNGAIDENALPQLSALLSDLNFAYGVDKLAKLHADKSKGKSYYSRFSVESLLNNVKRNNPVYVPGAAHDDDHCYMFRCGFEQQTYEQIIHNENAEQSKISLQTIDHITKLITNFAKFDEPAHQNDPVKDFHPIQNGQNHFLDVTNDGLKMGLDPNKEANELWASIEQETTE